MPKISTSNSSQLSVRGCLHQILLRLDEILSMLRKDKQREEQLMATLQDVQDSVTANGSVVDSAVALLEGLAQQLADALASNDPNAVQAVVDQINAQKQELADAVAANTPAQP
jgi:hypothetical protein